MRVSGVKGGVGKIAISLNLSKRLSLNGERLSFYQTFVYLVKEDLGKFQLNFE
jgi:septum formation inhibitor-activating ATPase MinD